MILVNFAGFSELSLVSTFCMVHEFCLGCLRSEALSRALEMIITADEVFSTACRHGWPRQIELVPTAWSLSQQRRQALKDKFEYKEIVIGAGVYKASSCSVFAVNAVDWINGDGVGDSKASSCSLFAVNAVDLIERDGVGDSKADSLVRKENHVKEVELFACKKSAQAVGDSYTGGPL